MRVSSRGRETTSHSAQYVHAKVRRVSEHAQEEQSSVRAVQVRDGQDEQKDEEARAGHDHVEEQMGEL